MVNKQTQVVHSASSFPLLGGKEMGFGSSLGGNCDSVMHFDLACLGLYIETEIYLRFFFINLLSAERFPFK